jgi:hypothetical protein
MKKLYYLHTKDVYDNDIVVNLNNMLYAIDLEDDMVRITFIGELSLIVKCNILAVTKGI